MIIINLCVSSDGPESMCSSLPLSLLARGWCACLTEAADRLPQRSSEVLLHPLNQDSYLGPLQVTRHAIVHGEMLVVVKFRDFVRKHDIIGQI